MTITAALDKRRAQSYRTGMDKRNITIIGDGAMGTVCAIMLAENGHDVRLWSAFPDAAAELAETRENKRFLPGVTLRKGIEITGNDSEALRNADLAVSAVPTQFMRLVWQRLAGYVRDDLPICSVAKGIEQKTLLSPTGIIHDVLKQTQSVAGLSGPCIAPEIARQLPATATTAATVEGLAEEIQTLFTRPYFRVYTNDDLIGVEIAGATKNVIAIAAGMLDGLGAGDNAKAALLTRGLVEITRLGEAMGARAETFVGLAGMGDLVTTCISPVGRNRSFGEAVGRGKSVADALAATQSVVEGVATTDGVMELAKRHNVDMPITAAVQAVLSDVCSPAEAIMELMARPPKAER